MNWKKVIENRIEHFESTHHRYEAKKLEEALQCINEFMPPYEFEEASEPLAVWVNPVLCPKCNGQGFVLTPPWVAGDVHTFTTSTPQSYQCGVCNGAKVLYPKPVHP